MAKLKMSSPWVIFYKEVEAMFKFDREVTVVYDEDEAELKLYVDNPDKAEALAQLLPTEKIFGNVTLRVTIIPSNQFSDLKGPRIRATAFNSNIFNVAFAGNEAFCYATTLSGIYSNPLTYVVFRREVVQYYTDDLGDINGIASTLYQDIAKDIFVSQEMPVFYCTDTANINALTTMPF